MAIGDVITWRGAARGEHAWVDRSFRGPTQQLFAPLDEHRSVVSVISAAARPRRTPGSRRPVAC